MARPIAMLTIAARASLIFASEIPDMLPACGFVIAMAHYPECATNRILILKQRVCQILKQCVC